MDFSWIVPLLSLLTLGIVAALAAAGKLAIVARQHDPSIPPSTLATDGPFGGVGFLRPIDPSARQIARTPPVLE
jgi:hypothetical protein